MYCFRCGSKLPPRVVNCPDCDTPQKRRQRYRSRMILGLFIFLAGAVAGSLFDTVVFKGRAWEHSFLGALNSQETASQTAAVSLPPAPAEPESLLSNNPDVTSVQTDSDTDSADTVSFQEAPEASGMPDQAETATASARIDLATATLNLVASQSATQTSAEVASLAAVATPVASTPANLGRLAYASVDTLEKGPGSNYHGSLARDGSELIFSSNRLKVNGKSVYQCFSKKPANDAKAVRVFEWEGNVWTPEVTPDGSKIVFSSDSSSPEHIFVYDRRTSKAKALTSGDSKNMMCAVSPDGRLVAFTSSQKGGANNIWLIGIDGDNLLQLTSSAEDDREPRWSTDGKTLYFSRIHTYMKKSHIMKIQLDPLGEAQSVVAGERRNWLPDVSPDGSALAYVRSESEDGSKNVLVVRQLLSGEETVINPLGKADYFRPVWAADGSGFVFHASIADSRSLYFARFKRAPQGN